MKQYIKNYIEHHDIGEQDIVLCKACLQQIAVDIHHITFRSNGGSDGVENLIALCRDCHDLAHASKLTKEYLYSLL